MYYIRRMSKVSNISKIFAAEFPKQIGSDFLGQEMRTSDNALSVWRSESLEADDLNNAIKAALFTSTDLITTQFIILNSDELEKIGISVEDTEGKTGYSGLENLHTDLRDLTYEKIGSLLELYHEVSKVDNRTPKIQKNEFKEIVREAASQDAINKDALDSHLRDAINKLLTK